MMTEIVSRMSLREKERKERQTERIRQLERERENDRK